MTTEVCVHTTVREANDRGYRCIVLGDCCASYFPQFHDAGLAMIAAQGGIFGWVSSSREVLAALAARVAANGVGSDRRMVRRDDDDDGIQATLWTPGDWNAFFGFGTNILVNLLVLTGLLQFVLKMPSDIVFGRILPALGLMMFLSTGYYAWLAYSLAKKTGRNDVCALPSGISVPHMFVVTFVIMLPIAAEHRRPDQGMGGRARLGLLPKLHPDARRLRRALHPQGHASRRAPRHARRRLDRLHLDAAGDGDLPHARDRHRLPRHHSRELVRRRALSARHSGRPRRRRLFGIVVAWAAAALGLDVGGMSLAKLASAFANFGFSVPLPAVDHVFSGFQYLGVILVTAIPFGIYDLVEAMDNVESAEAAGDHFPTTRVLTADGVVSLIGCLLGNPFINAVYIGHPGWKSMGGRIGYSAATGVMVMVLCWFGIISLLLAIVPIVAISPILLYIGMLIGAQAFQTTPAKHAPAIVLALTPHLAAWAKTLVDGSLTAAGTSAAQVGLEKLGMSACCTMASKSWAAARS